jgi:hypothetical protein
MMPVLLHLVFDVLSHEASKIVISAKSQNLFFLHTYTLIDD